jgi:hypothetical protein
MDDCALDSMLFGPETVDSVKKDIAMLQSLKSTTELEKKLTALLLKGKCYVLADAICRRENR